MTHLTVTPVLLSQPRGLLTCSRRLLDTSFESQQLGPLQLQVKARGGMAIWTKKKKPTRIGPSRTEPENQLNAQHKSQAECTCGLYVRSRHFVLFRVSLFLTAFRFQRIPRPSDSDQAIDICTSREDQSQQTKMNKHKEIKLLEYLYI